MVRKHAFTLIELLVVIAIISLLVSILLPSLNRAKDLAKRAICAAHLKDVGLSIAMYANDNNDCMPVSRGSYAGSGGGSNPTGTETYHWYNLLSKYAGMETEFTYDPDAVGSGTVYYGYHDVFKGCPNWDAEAHDPWNPGYGMVWMIHGRDGEEPTDESSEYMNYFDASTDPKKCRFWRRSEFSLTTQRGWIGDSTEWHIGGGPNEEYKPTPDRLWPTWASETIIGDQMGSLGRDPERHLESSNILFVDGRVQSYRYDQGGNAFYYVADLPIQ